MPRGEPRPEDFILCHPGAASPKRTMTSSGLLQHNQLRTCEGKPRHVDQYLTLPSTGYLRDTHDSEMHAKFGRGEMSVTVNGVKTGASAAAPSTATAGTKKSSASRRGYSEGAKGPRGHANRDPKMYTDYVTTDPAHQKWMPVTVGPDGHFPHPVDPDKLGLPMFPDGQVSEKAPGLPSNYVKPAINTSAISYNYFRSNPDLYENDQRQYSYFMERQHKFNKEMKRLIDNSGNSYSKEYYIHATTKPLGRMYFDNKSRIPKFQLTDEMAALCLPEGYQRKHYDFWR